MKLVRVGATFGFAMAIAFILAAVSTAAFPAAWAAWWELPLEHHLPIIGTFSIGSVAIVSVRKLVNKILEGIDEGDSNG